MERISFIIPSRNNLDFLKQAIRSIQNNYQDQHDIVILDDASTDGTWEWIESIQSHNIICYRNNGPERLGHTILYDKGVDISKTDIFSILHADMVVTPNYVNNLIKHLNRGTVVCATRIEPPLHPPGPEKIVKHFGFNPEEFNEKDLLSLINIVEQENKDQVTKGMFAPWCMYKSDFQAIGGHDKLFAPMELEDSDIFNRMKLAGYELIQSRDSFVYHMTCRGSRFKDGLEIEAEIPLSDGTIWYKPKDSEEYKALRAIKFREWWRKWGSNVMHTPLMDPIVIPKYNIAFVIKNTNLELVNILEPWCDRLYIDDNTGLIQSKYISKEQQNTLYDLKKRVLNLSKNYPDAENDIIITFDSAKLTNDNFQILQQISQIIQQSGEIGEFELDIFKIKIISMNTYEQKFITNSDPYYVNQLL